MKIIAASIKEVIFKKESLKKVMIAGTIGKSKAEDVYSELAENRNVKVFGSRFEGKDSYINKLIFFCS